jgi:hypothetical protein
MSASDEYSIYYLTDDGWQCVFTKHDFSGCVQNCPIPEKYYLICKYREYLPSAYGKIELTKTLDETYRDVSQEGKIQKLLIKFGDCPNLV